MPIIPITIDITHLAQQFKISKKQAEDVCDNVAKTMAASYARTLEKEAQKNLSQTRSRYIHNIRVIDSGRLEGTVLLDFSKDKLVRMIELGASPFDIKAGLLSGPNSKITNKGKRYATVPFRWATPDSLGESDVFSGKMPKAVYKEAKKLAPLGRLTDKRLQYPLNMASKREEIKDSAGKVLFKQYQHKSSVFQGISRVVDAKTGQSRYFSFRRVSENSDPDSFIHPGIPQYNLMKKALSNFNQEEELSNALDYEWNKLFQ